MDVWQRDNTGLFQVAGNVLCEGHLLRLLHRARMQRRQFSTDELQLRRRVLQQLNELEWLCGDSWHMLPVRLWARMRRRGFPIIPVHVLCWLHVDAHYIRCLRHNVALVRPVPPGHPLLGRRGAARGVR